MGINYNSTQNYGQSWKNTVERLYPSPIALCIMSFLSPKHYTVVATPWMCQVLSGPTASKGWPNGNGLWPGKLGCG